MGRARQSRSRAFPSRAPAGFGCYMRPSSARSREPTQFSTAAARGARARVCASDPSPTVGVGTNASAGWGRGREPRGRACDVQANPPWRPRARTRDPEPPAPMHETLIPPGALGEGVPTSLPRPLPRVQSTDSQPPPLRHWGMALTMFPEAKRRQQGEPEKLRAATAAAGIRLNAASPGPFRLV